MSDRFYCFRIKEICFYISCHNSVVVYCYYKVPLNPSQNRWVLWRLLPGDSRWRPNGHWRRRAPGDRPVYNRLLLTGSHTAAGRPPPGSHTAESKITQQQLLSLLKHLTLVDTGKNTNRVNALVNWNHRLGNTYSICYRSFDFYLYKLLDYNQDYCHR